ncbi:MAG: hypothetical protein JO221_01245 [Sphingomonas sp.]|nr:hypothetical protein [Sphingomonas sp.]
MIAWAVEALLASALLIALVLAIRIPVRRAFGAPVAYALWLLPVLRLLLPPLPTTLRDGVVPPLAAPLHDMGREMSVMILPATDAPAAATHSLAALLGAGFVLLWGVGALAVIGWQFVTYLRFRRRLLAAATPLDRIDGVTIVASPAAAGPLAFGVTRRFVAFPRDFAGRYDAGERELALAHELGHHARGDLIANWVALAVLALHWFNPLVWFAFRAYRADQEMANDARVLAGRSASERHAYACAIVKAAHGGAIAAACHLHTVDDLKGRLRMLATPATRARLLAGGVGVVALGAAALGLTATGTAAAEQMRARMERATGIDIDAIKPSALLRPPPPVMPEAQPAPAATPAPGERRNRVVVHNDGETHVYEGADADAYRAAHPVPVPPVPPVPPAPHVEVIAPVPPVPPVPPMHFDREMARADREAARAERAAARAMRAAPVVSSQNCGEGSEMTMHTAVDGRNVTVICRDRIAHAGDAARQAARIDAAEARRNALRSAIAGLRASRASLAANASMPEEGRRAAIASIDRSIARMEHNIPDPDQ